MAYAGEGLSENHIGNRTCLLVLRVNGRIMITYTIPDKDAEVAGPPSSLLDIRI